MVDAVVSYAVERLGDYLIREANFLGEVRNEVESLKRDLEWMHSFIRDAEEKQVDNALIRQWMSDIRDIAYDSEDVLDTFFLQVRDEQIASNMLKVEGETATRKHRLLSSIKKSVVKPSSQVKEKVILYNIGKEIEALKNRLTDVSRRRELYGLHNIGTKGPEDSHALRRLQQLRRTTSFSFEDNIVGYEDEASKLLAKLLDNEPRRFIISIWGTGGLGKTTLAGKLYHNHAVRQKFIRRAWVSVSQEYSCRDLLQRIIKSFNITSLQETLEKMNEEDLERHLHKSLQKCSYLVVIDDVWHKEAWASLKRAFPDNKNGSRVIITTRIKDVAQRSDERTHVHELRFLNSDESWQLFNERTFSNLNGYQGSEKLGREMVGKCGGLPLAIVVLSGLLSTKQPQEWHLVRDDIWQNLSNDSIQVTYLLDLSFRDLPYQLKLCFLYLSHFPEDFEIQTVKLIRLWVAEGFIPHDQGIMEDVAQDNLNQLINRSLIQKENMCLGRAVTCRVHDLLRDLAIEKAKELNFIHIYDETIKSNRFSKLSCRRQALYSGIHRFWWQTKCTRLLRSLLFFDLYTEHPNIEKVLPILGTRLRYLRVLNFEYLQGKTSGLCLPKDIGNLIHLKYLGLINLSIVDIPSTILNLSNLETLDFQDIYRESVSLPTEICKLQKLRHLIGDFRKQYLQIDSMTNLQTLMYIRGDTWTKTNPEKLVNLRELHMFQYNGGKKFIYDYDEEEFSFDSFGKLKSLRILSVYLLQKSFFASFQPLHHCRYLQHLNLAGEIKKLPEEMHVLLPNLERLSLYKSNLVDDPMSKLEKLPNLMLLGLGYNCYCGKKLVCWAKGFPRLEILLLNAIHLEELQVDEGAMPMLRGLKIINNSEFGIPERLRSIPLPADSEYGTTYSGDYTGWK